MAAHLWIAFTATTLALMLVASAHSLVSVPEGISASSCRMGGDPKFGVKKCPGPCDFTKIEGERVGKEWANYFPRSGRTSASYKRGQTVQIKYTRNNHAPGGFNRFSLVPVDKMKDKAAYAANAFHFSCWGAHPVAAKPDELEKEKYGFSLVGSDGQEHDHPKGYYTVDIKIPDVVPDGKYMLGWAWFGGPGGKVKGNAPQEPSPYSYFSDYWSCSFVEVSGGAPLASSYTPVFVNDMDQYSTEGCMAHADDVGQCTYEPCRDRKGSYRKPAAFLGSGPTPITPANFGGDTPPPQDTPTADPPKETPTADPTPTSPPKEEYPKETPTVDPTPTSPPKEEYPKETPVADPPMGDYPKESPAMDVPVDKVYFDRALMSCLCISGSRYGCFEGLAAFTNDCTANERSYRQTKTCRESCCALCKETGEKFSACRHEYTQWVCKNQVS